MDEVTFVRVSLEVIETRPALGIERILLSPPCMIHTRAQETVWVATFNAAGNLHNVAMVAQGGFDESHVHIPALMNIIALSGTDRFLIAHNHPNGYAAPSQLDIAFTADVARASDAIGFYLEDHLIFDGRGRSTSMARTGLLRPRAAPVLRLERRPA